MTAGPHRQNGTEEPSPIEQAKQRCVCGHLRVGHNRVGGACNYETCACKHFIHYLAPFQPTRIN